MKEVTIREYRSSDFDALTVLWLASWQSAGVRIPNIATLTALRRRLPQELPKWSTHVAAKRDRIVGFVAIRGDQLEQIFVHPAYQSRGIGKGLLELVKQQCPDGFRLHTQVQNYRARRFYAREGLLPGKPGLGRHPGYRIIPFEWRPDRLRTG